MPAAETRRGVGCAAGSGQRVLHRVSIWACDPALLAVVGLTVSVAFQC